jgi:hypothetical protein
MCLGWIYLYIFLSCIVSTTFRIRHVIWTAVSNKDSIFDDDEFAVEFINLTVGLQIKHDAKLH